MDRSDSDDKDEVLTLGEYFQNEEEEANEVSGLLSASDSKNCSYDQVRKHFILQVSSTFLLLSVNLRNYVTIQLQFY